MGAHCSFAASLAAAATAAGLGAAAEARASSTGARRPSAAAGAGDAHGGFPCGSIPENASAALVLQCIQRRRERGKLRAYQDVVAEAEQEAVDHLQRNQDSRLGVSKLPLSTPATPYFQKQALEWAAGKMQPLRIYVMGGGWERSCDFQEQQLGYRYSMEHWAYKNLMANEAILVEDYMAADFVYLPHCVTGIFMHLAAKFELEMRAAEEAAKSKTGRGRRINQTDGVEVPQMTPNQQAILAYEGNLPARATHFADHAYLLELLRNRWALHPAYEHCWRRENCRFLIVSIYGRHVFRGFAQHFGDAAVYVTHAGLSDWLLARDPGFFAAGNPGSVAECRAACPDHCVRNPPAVLPNDIVLPWTQAYFWTSRSHAFESRDILAFFSGTANSCSRDQLADLFRDSYKEQMQELARAPEARPFAERILVFPPDQKLSQGEWSELAYRSRLCIVPDGDSPNTGRLIEVIMHGCVPLIISNRLQPPLHEFIEWSSIALFVAEDALPKLSLVLRSLSRPKGMRRIAERHANLAKAARILHYGNSGMQMLFFALQDRARKAREAATAAKA